MREAAACAVPGVWAGEQRTFAGGCVCAETRLYVWGGFTAGLPGWKTPGCAEGAGAAS